MIRLFLGGCQIKIKFSCFALLAFCCLFAGFSSSAFVFLAAFLHELSHLAVLFLFRAPPGAAVFSALGCQIVLGTGRKLSYFQNAAVSLAGPAANLLCWALLCAAGYGDALFAAACLALGLLHSLPVEPLDGGLALKALLSAWLGRVTAGKITFVLSLLCLIPLAVLGFLVLLRTRYNFTLLALSLYLMLYLVLKRDFLED